VIDVANDAEGARIALEEIFEEDYVRSRVELTCADISQETRDRLAAQVPPRTLSPGYYEFAEHLLWLDSERAAGIGFSAEGLAAFEVRGLVALGRARTAFDGRHPKCSRCGARQPGRFGVECSGCGAKFARKGQ
jgi:hypothetical protein